MDIKLIIEAWQIAKNPTKEQSDLAYNRIEICKVCPSRKVLLKRVKLTEVCGECGCVIIKKVFSNKYNPCPLSKWGKIDEPYFEKQKDNKTII